MEPLIVVNYPEPLNLEARPIEHDSTPEGEIAMGYYHNGALIARSIVSPDSIEAIHTLLSTPVALALAATEDQQGNIDGRLCLVLPIEDDRIEGDVGEHEEDDEPWKASVPPPPMEIEDSGSLYEDEELNSELDLPRVVLLPIGNVVRSARNRHHPNNPAFDAREMLDNILAGAAEDAVAKAIDDLLNSI